MNVNKEIHERQGYIFTIDFKSAFDRVSTKFMIEQLKTLGFGSACIKMIETMYK